MGRPRHFEKAKQRTDFYRPTDYFGLANSFAKGYCKDHPEADKNIVNAAARDAAFVYANSTTCKKYKFKTFINVKVRYEIFQERKKEMSKYSDELKAEIISDKNGGMTCREIAEKHGLTAKQIENIITWNKPRNEKASKLEIPDLEGKAEQEPPKKPYKKPEIIEMPVCKRQEPSQKPRSIGMWEAIANELPGVLSGLFGAGIKIQSISSSEEYEKAVVKGVTADGIGVRIKVEIK